ncbi:MAG: ribosome silencing factor [Bacteroidetes bacterium]|nr:ribosome silencing factor [Bacteroidota bacterium]
MQEKRGRDIVALNLKGLSGASTQYFVTCHGQSDRQAESIAKSVEEYLLKNYGLKPFHREGYENKEWILLDYFDVVAHIFIKSKREFFAIEELWADAAVEEFENVE